MEIADCDSPHVAGWIRPTIVIPLELTTPEIPKKTWQAVLAHECGHIAQGDFLIWKLLTLLQVVHWFNPILWYAFRRMREDAEFACDDQVLRRQSDLSQVEYGRALLFVAELGTESDTHTLAFAKSQLYRRVEQILHFRAAYSIAVAAVLLFVLASFSFLLGFRSSSTVQIAWEFREDGLYADTKADGNLQKVSLPEDTLSALVDDDTTRCIYVDTTKIALLYSNSTIENGISIALSQDGGQNWINPELPQVYAQLGEPYPITFFSHLYMGFTSQKDGWVIGQDTQYGTMDQFIFRTHDGGYTWELVATQDNEGGLVNTLADAMFIDKDRGFMCFDSNAYAAPIYFTDDGGVTWERIALPLPLDEAVYWNYDFQINNGIGRIFLLMQDLTPPRGMEMLIFECDLSVPGEEDQWKLLNPSEPYPLDAKRATILHSGEGYQLTLPEPWAGHFANMQYTPGIDQHPAGSFPIQGLFSLYETYNLSHIVFDTKRYGFLFAIQAYPIAQATEEDRTASHVLGQDSIYYFTVVTSPGNNYIEDGTGEQAYKALAADIPDILAQFVADNHLTRNPNFQL
ncbi:MAG: M56 family metallopeptidase [Butyricicoccus sp.]|nr:M56 family metallopeptidase [Butyricicoccus sp.]